MSPPLEEDDGGRGGDVQTLEIPTHRDRDVVIERRPEERSKTAPFPSQNENPFRMLLPRGVEMIEVAFGSGFSADADKALIAKPGKSLP